MTAAEIIARIAERQAELDRLGDFGAHAEPIRQLHADMAALATIVADLERVDLVMLTEIMRSLEQRIDALEAMFETAGSA